MSFGSMHWNYTTKPVYIHNPLSGDSSSGEGQTGQVSVISVCAETCDFALLCEV